MPAGSGRSAHTPVSVRHDLKLPVLLLVLGSALIACKSADVVQHASLVTRLECYFRHIYIYNITIMWQAYDLNDLNANYYGNFRLRTIFIMTNGPWITSRLVRLSNAMTALSCSTWNIADRAYVDDPSK